MRKARIHRLSNVNLGSLQIASVTSLRQYTRTRLSFNTKRSFRLQPKQNMNDRPFACTAKSNLKSCREKNDLRYFENYKSTGRGEMEEKMRERKQNIYNPDVITKKRKKEAK